MKLLGKRAQIYLPMLERFFGSTIECEGKEIGFVQIYRDLLSTPYSDTKNRSTIIDLEEVSRGDLSENEYNFILVTRVKDVIRLIDCDENLIHSDTVLITTLRTHVEELRKATNCTVIYIPFEGTSPINLTEEEYLDKGFERTIFSVNFDLDLSTYYIKNIKCLVNYRKHAYTPCDDNYANEFNDYHHIARIIGVPVYTAVTEGELNFLKEKVNAPH